MAAILSTVMLLSMPDPVDAVPKRPVLECAAPLASCDSFVLAYTMPLVPIITPDISGWWSQYDKRPTDAVIDYRGWRNEDVDGFIAVPDCKRVGQYAHITINDSDWERVRVFDCLGAGGDPSWWKENYIIGEIDYYLAREYDVVHKGNVKAEIAWE